MRSNLFKEAVKASIDAMLIAHFVAVSPEIDNGQIASMSSLWISPKCCAKRWGLTALCFSDDMRMKG